MMKCDYLLWRCPTRSLLFIVCMLINTAGAHAETYHIGSGDLLSVNVYGEPDLSRERLRVTTQGTISFPLLGDIKVAGQTEKDIEKAVTEKLRDGYLKKPRVSVSVLEYRMFYVTGQVRSPGGYHYVEGLNVRKAIALAGGFTVRASEKKLMVIPDDDPENKVRVDMATRLGPGDILHVGESFF